MSTATGELLHVLGYLYLRCGQNRRALYLMRLADLLEPDDEGITKTLAVAYLSNRRPQEALEVISRLKGDASQVHLASLLKSRALLQLGREEEARACFDRYVEQRPPAEQASGLDEDHDFREAS